MSTLRELADQQERLVAKHDAKVHKAAAHLVSLKKSQNTAGRRSVQSSLKQHIEDLWAAERVLALLRQRLEEDSPGRRGHHGSAAARKPEPRTRLSIRQPDSDQVSTHCYPTRSLTAHSVSADVLARLGGLVAEEAALAFGGWERGTGMVLARNEDGEPCVWLEDMSQPARRMRPDASR